MIVEIPEVYELVNIAIAMTPIGTEDRNLVYKDSITTSAFASGSTNTRSIHCSSRSKLTCARIWAAISR